MTRIKRGTAHLKRRKNLLRKAKGYHLGRGNLIRLAKPAVRKAGVSAFRDRRRKKREKRLLWQVRINAATRENGVNYSTFINMLKQKNIELDRKVLSTLAETYPAVFAKVVEHIK